MTVNEYANIKTGQEVLVTYSGYEGYYKGKVVSINPNTIASPDKMSYLYTGVIEADNPGLISLGTGVGVHIGSNGQVSSTLSYSSKVESYAEQVQIKSPIYSSTDNELNVIKLNVIEGQAVKKGDQIAVLGGPAIANRMKKDAKSIKSKLDQNSKIQREINKELETIYGDLIKSNVPNKFRIGEDGICYTTERIFVDYVASGPTVRKGETIFKYRVCDDENLSITTIVDENTFNKIYDDDIRQQTNVTYFNKDSTKTIKARVLEFRRFDDRFEIEFNLVNDGYNKYILNEEIDLTSSSQTVLWNVVPKTAILPIDGYEKGKYCYIYLIEEEDTMHGIVDVVRQKSAYINYAGRDFVSINIMDNLVDTSNIRLVNNISTVLKDGMRVKAKK